MSDTCGQCRYGIFIKNEVMHRMCFGGPPTAHMVLDKQGRANIQNVRPVVKTTEPACGVFQRRELSPAQIRALEEQENAVKTPQNKIGENTQPAGNEVEGRYDNGGTSARDETVQTDKPETLTVNAGPEVHGDKT